jgi:hypothetical protein
METNLDEIPEVPQNEQTSQNKMTQMKTSRRDIKRREVRKV